jgi:predicted transcriptional regulator of viral defense system
MISDREKTAIDCIDHPALTGGVGEAATILATASRRFDWVKAAGYLERIGSGALVRRFGWLADHVKAGIPPDVRDRLLRLAAKSRATWLGSDPARAPVVPGAIGDDKTWCLFVNVTPEKMHGSAGVGRRKATRRKTKNAYQAAGTALLH